MSSLLLRSLVLALLLGTAPIAASAEDGAEAGDEPLVIGMDDLAGITAGSHATPWGPAGRPTYRRSTRIETHISMPIAHAIAVCYFCSGNASAVAMATANVVGGFLVTHRMLGMFRRKDR